MVTETPHKLRKSRKQVQESPQVTGKPEKVLESTEQRDAVTEEPQEPPTAVPTQEPEQPHTEDAEETEQPPTEHPEEQEQPATEEVEHTLTENPEQEQVATEQAGEAEQPSTATATPGQVQSASRGKRRASRKLSSVGVRQSPRLSAISKVLLQLLLLFFII